ncbi:hypothetical protein VNI00_008767 [Paramarasmius palmivorus]|uniref:Uncharacterized protein n=1 Tax=Paramarasmius palmivorus TaxID=297713 RepID=A0AAW0CVE5_9AGAR
MLGYSVYHGLLSLSLTYLVAITVYNYGLSKSPLLKNPLSGFGYFCSTWGSMYIIGHNQPLSTVSAHSAFASWLTYAVTGHAQDFRDRSGDVLMGRKTIPLIFSQRVARGYLICALFGTTCGLIKLWSPPPSVIYVFTFLCLGTSMRFAMLRTEEEDEINYVCYAVWLILAHFLPIFGRVDVWNTYLTAHFRGE